ncbi:hypothetical protein [Nocardiopsis metallicus]|uniref:Antitoxin (DNA-binding transcriptional repressor) of toxin-antitoxin stability system n=1 Tax=Nocardiopsis metallicus TaxID=179819 RepID=A0A840WS46_9ACTN|nr:hypothetical protein [Nocardiopsis metallicus]MBB5494745.1 antitoxin (DNA-binding transcriptional repressor) of toxin-antitoxin stability system [Nocardiopsis metallicus]
MPEWQRIVEGLLSGSHSPTGDDADAGAQLVVTDPGGQVVFRAALARHCRLDQDEENLLWIRPIAPGSDDPSSGVRVYNLELCRRRALTWEKVESAGEAVIFTLQNGQVARVEPAQNKELEELQAWDAFILGLSADEEQELDSLDSDSWCGRHS